jgi:pimeloyl-ACP methyl ester carboxylesterase
METITSTNGTLIAYERSGAGPPLVLVHGTTADHTRWASVLPCSSRPLLYTPLTGGGGARVEMQPNMRSSVSTRMLPRW